MPNNRKRSEELREKQKSTVEQLRERSDLSKKDLEDIAEYQKVLDKEVVKSKRVLMRELEEEAHKKRMEDAEKEGNELKKFWEKNFGTTGALVKSLSSVTNTLTSAIDESLNKYIGAQQSMSAHLQGSNTSISEVLNKLQSTLSTSGVIKQEKVFDNLGSLIKTGITYNVEQRAFLQTIAEDIDATFNAQNGSLTRLIRIQNQDLSANRLAIEYSLQKFLNQNYQTSEYIKQAFEGVSNSLLSAQVALQNSTEAIRLESAVQTQLGAMYSGGISGNTVQGLADAINALGTGDVSNLGSGMSNLLIMAAARAGMDYGQLLNQGVTGQQATTLLNSVVNYLSEMNANQSNVVKSQMGKLFGVDITDIIAASNIGSINGSVGSDIGDLFKDYSGFMSFGTKIQNTLANLKWSFGTNIASSPSQLMTYEITRLIQKSGIGDILYQVGDAVSGIGKGPITGLLSGASGALIQLAGIAANTAPLIPIISSFFGGDGLISDISSSIKAGTGGISSLFSSLGSSISGDISSATIKMSQAGTSGGIYIGNGSVSDLLAGSMSSLNDITSLTSGLQTISGDEISLEDNVSTMTSDLASILEILDTYISSIDEKLQSIALNTVGEGGGNGVVYATSNRGTRI